MTTDTAAGVPDVGELERLLSDGRKAPWSFCETISDDGQEWFGCGVTDASGLEFIWLEDNPETDIPTVKAISQIHALAAEVIALRKDNEALRKRVEDAEEMATDLTITANNAQDAAKTDDRWDGVAEKLRARVATYRAGAKP